MRQFIGWRPSKTSAFIFVLAMAALFLAYWITALQDKGKLSQKEPVIKQAGWGGFDFGGPQYPVLYNQAVVSG